MWWSFLGLRRGIQPRARRSSPASRTAFLGGNPRRAGGAEKAEGRARVRVHAGAQVGAHRVLDEGRQEGRHRGHRQRVNRRGDVKNDYRQPWVNAGEAEPGTQHAAPQATTAYEI